MVRMTCEVVDPVTGATYRRPRRYASEVESPHTPPVIPFRSAFASTQQNAFRRWLQSFPHWQLPRSPFPGWVSHSDTDYRNFASEETEDEDTFEPSHSTPHPQYAPLRMSGSRLDFLRNRYTSPCYRTPPLGPVPDILPDRVPDIVEWQDVYGGTLHWSPHPWRAHPLPHPALPSQHFWASAYPQDSPTGWRGPGGLPANAVDPQLITGGHPLPGHDPWWTPSRWTAPLPGYYSHQHIIISPFLAANGRDPVAPHILWDASVQPPGTIRRVTARGDIVDLSGTDSFTQPATWPNAQRVLINLPNMYNGWGPVTIEKTDDTIVCVKDVFEAIAKFLHSRLSQAEYHSVCTMQPRRRDMISYAFHRRCWASPHLYKNIYSDGVKRVDLLDTPVFWGCWPNYSDPQPGTVTLDMGFLPRHALPSY